MSYRHVLAGFGLMLALGAFPATGTASAAIAASATVTTLQAPQTARYDSPVTFTAQVTAPSGTPAGAVTLTDASNGSVLDTVALTSGVAHFSTAALAPGARKIIARYNGSADFLASSSAAARLMVKPASDAVDFQIDPGHDGDQEHGNLTTKSLAKKWTVTLGAEVSYPLVADGRVFAIAGHSPITLFALSAGTGKTEWSARVGGNSGYAAAAYDGRRVFVIDGNGLLSAFREDTGRRLWSVQLPSGVVVPPTAYDGVVYVSDPGLGGSVYAVGEADGVIRWLVGVLNGSGSAPAVDGSGAYVSFGCGQAYRINLRGQKVWHYDPGCDGGGGSAPALSRRYVYIRGFRDLPLIVNKNSGDPVNPFLSDAAPAFDRLGMYTLQHGTLVAMDPLANSVRWTFGHGNLVTAPVASGGIVFIGGSDGTVFGVSARSGAEVWHRSAGAPITGGGGGASDGIAMAVAGGLLVVPAGPKLTAFGG